MRGSNGLIRTVGAIHAAGLDEDLWPDALREVSKLFGSVGATFERVDKQARRLMGFRSHGIPPGREIAYIDHYMSINPRVAFGLSQQKGELGYDYMLLDEAAMDRDPYYADFLPEVGVRYFISVTLAQTEREFACIAVQRSRKQGHAGSREIKLMELLQPHLQQAFDTNGLLTAMARSAQALERTLDWLPEAAVLVQGDGSVVYANRAAEAAAGRSDGFGISRNRIEFASAAARTCFDQALASLLRLREGTGDLSVARDFRVSRLSGLPAYVASIRPVAGDLNAFDQRAQFLALLVLQDPSYEGSGREMSALGARFGLTAAESRLASALLGGMSLAHYAREREVSINTIYTHLRRIKAKTGARRMSELIAALGSSRPPLRKG